jgi:hypothetical protein
MRKVAFLLALFISAPSIAAVIEFDRVTTYVGGAAIPSAKVPTIQYKAYYGPNLAGPWTTGATVTDNLAITAPDPPAGATWWYSVTASLDGQESAKCVPDSKAVAFQTPAQPPGCRVR